MNYLNYFMRPTLHQAVQNGNVAVVQEILEREPSSVNNWDLEFQTPLHLVYDNNDVLIQPHNKMAIAKLLIDYGANVNARGNKLETPLHLAVKKQQMEGVKFLLDNKADPNIINTHSKTALHYATQKNKYIVEMLLEYKADPNITDCDDQVPLDIAISSHNIDAEKNLVALGAKSVNSYRSLVEACNNSYELWTCQKTFIKYVIELAPELDAYVDFSLKSLLYYIVSKNHQKNHRTEDPCFLLDILHELKVKIKDDMNDSDLHKAVRDEDEEAIKTLLKNGANVNSKNFFGETPLHLVLRVTRTCKTKWIDKIAELLVENGG
ncbi:serine/threonine-protein phosphatase 6 regulatory ankyrin repeat subunit A-like [Copidosoma floridanum]|uniref:serine/threonine-protein phosphatase 6 regulatory ankyrin repeat subunit A-like n=1 Tax=Copidosoma floridanum TaxID=29053 RepID=UPI0006C9D88C|nr:serine/threonine-protein phosphatase 6 regulatory ankyrin repeat subunit A-like [Copidosoma floridanum]